MVRAPTFEDYEEDFFRRGETMVNLEIEVDDFSDMDEGYEAPPGVGARLMGVTRLNRLREKLKRPAKLAGGTPAPQRVDDIGELAEPPPPADDVVDTRGEGYAIGRRWPAWVTRRNAGIGGALFALSVLGMVLPNDVTPRSSGSGVAAMVAGQVAPAMTSNNAVALVPSAVTNDLEAEQSAIVAPVVEPVSVLDAVADTVADPQTPAVEPATSAGAAKRSRRARRSARAKKTAQSASKTTRASASAKKKTSTKNKTAKKKTSTKNKTAKKKTSTKNKTATKKTSTKNKTATKKPTKQQTKPAS